MIKCDLHIHTSEDEEEGHDLCYDARDLIDRASHLDYDLISITLHDKVIFDEELSDYAESKGVELIPGVERTIEGKHVLLYNLTSEEMKSIDSFDDLRMMKGEKDDLMVIAPHPYFIFSSCLKEDLEDNIDLFDGIEFSSFHMSWFNLNRKAEKMAKKYDKALVGNSDAHIPLQFGTTFSLVDCEGKEGLVESVREGDVKVFSRPFSFWEFFKVGFRFD